VFLLVAVGSLRSLIGERTESWTVTALTWVLIAISCGALHFSRRRPVAVGVIVWAASSAFYLLSTYDGPLMAAFAVSLYVVAAEGRLRAAVALGALAVTGTGIGTLAGNATVNGVALFMLTGWLVGTIALGWARHSRLAYAREAEQRAATEERLRIARELHDVVGHHLSLINVQSAAALRRVRKHSGTGEEALAAIKDSSREALRELRATLGVLRQVDEAAPTAPPAGLDRLGELVASARLAGLDVTTYTSGISSSTLPTEVDLAAYRILQESLTNVTRHAHATAATVRIEHAPDHLTVEITDDGHGSSLRSPLGTGSGIVGMRERARALGGELAFGPGPAGGFTVRARLPRARTRRTDANGAPTTP
jgi:signal transduction histidine kinase